VLFTQPLSSALCNSTYCITQVREGHTHCDVCEAKQIVKPIPVSVIKRAQELYYKHLDIDSEGYEYMWNQCVPSYQQAWVTIAEADLED